jgi:RNA recognition motif-containing protein
VFRWLGLIFVLGADDHRIFVGDLGNEVNDDCLTKAFVKYASFAKAKVVRDKKSNKSKGFGFVSLLDPMDFAQAMREMNGKYIGNRPCKLKKSSWEDREAAVKGPKGGKVKRHIYHL